MKKILGVIAFVLLASRAFAAETCSALEPSRPQGELPTCLAIDASTTTTTGATVNTFGHRIIGTQVWSAAGSVATVQVECRSYASAPWWPCVNGGVVNPDATGVYYTLPRAYQYRLRISAYTSGTISGTIERYNQ